MSSKGIGNSYLGGEVAWNRLPSHLCNPRKCFSICDVIPSLHDRTFGFCFYFLIIRMMET